MQMCFPQDDGDSIGLYEAIEEANKTDKGDESDRAPLPIPYSQD